MADLDEIASQDPQDGNLELPLWEEFQRFRFGAIQCHNDKSSREWDEHQENAFNHLFPNYESWKWHRTASYWISILFLQGSWVFLITYIFELLPGFEDHPDRKAFTAWPSFVAGIGSYGVGAYLMLVSTVQVLNIPGLPVWFPFACQGCCALPKDLDDESEDEEFDEVAEKDWQRRFPYCIALVFFVGAWIFPIGLIEGVIPGKIPQGIVYLFSALPSTVGGAFFFIGGVMTLFEVGFFKGPTLTSPHITAVLNCGGGFCFLVGGFLGFFPGAGKWWAVIYWIGAALYVLMSIADLYMWRDEQFGLTYLMALNDVSRNASGQISAKPHSFSFMGFLFLNVYVALSVMNIFNICIEGWLFSLDPSVLSFIRILYETLPLMVSMITLAVHSTVVKFPQTEPFHCLMIVARMFSLFVLLASTAKFIAFFLRLPSPGYGHCVKQSALALNVTVQEMQMIINS